MENKRELIDFNDTNAIVNYGQDVVIEVTNLCDSLEARAPYIVNGITSFEMTEDEKAKFDELRLKLDELISNGEINKDAYHFDVEYYRLQSNLLETVSLKYQYLACKTRFDLFNVRLNYLKNIKNNLEFTESRFKKMQLKK